MRNKKFKIPVTLKVVVGYGLIITAAVYSIWFIYGQIETLSQSIENGNEKRLRYLQISEIAAKLFVAESISRDIIQNQDNEQLPVFERQIDSVRHLINNLKSGYSQEEMQEVLDSFNSLLNRKSLNLKELLELRQQATTESYYAKVISQLKRIDYNFEDENYEWQLRNHDPRVRKAIIGLINYSKENRKGELTQKTADSLINSLKNVLNSLERQERRIMQTINEKENELLQNDHIISNQLQDIRVKIEQEEMLKGLAEVNHSRSLLEKTSSVFALLGIVSVLTMLIFVTMIFYDTTNSQKYRKQLETAKNYSEALLKSREQIMNTVTHDLRSPLNTIIGYSSLLEKTPLTPQQSQYLKNLKSSSDYILNLVNDLLDISKLNAGKMHTEKIRFNLNTVVENAVKNAIPENKEKNIEISVIVDKAFNRDVLSDAFRIQQVLTNLISNAYKFTVEGSIKISATHQSKTENKNYVFFEIADTGIGIPKENQNLIFEEFLQVDTGNTDKNEGFGLGLSITRKIISLLKGTITLDSKKGKGSIFRCTIPIEFAENQLPEYKQTATPENLTGRVLIVDDDSAQLILTGEVVKKTGLVFDTASGVDTALRLLNKHAYNLVVTDIQMPGKDGFELLRKLREKKGYRHIPVIALSGRTDIKHRQFIDSGFAAHLVKPFTPNSLLEVLVRCLNILPHKEKSLIPEKKSYDLSDLLSFTGEDVNSLHYIIKTFVENTHENLVRLKSAGNHLDKVAEIAHRMLPMCRQLHVEEAVAILEKLELKQMPKEKIGEAVTNLELIFNVVTTQLRLEVQDLEDS